MTMKKLKISPNFTIDDIHKIREHNEELRKKIGWEAWRNKVNETARMVNMKIDALRKKKGIKEETP